MSLPEPLVPQEVDLRGLTFMPLDVARLRDSDLAIEATGDEFRAAVLLWCASWGQVPAGSLPNSDTALATYAGYGRGDIKGWRKVREGALRALSSAPMAVFTTPSWPIKPWRPGPSASSIARPRTTKKPGSRRSARTASGCSMRSVQLGSSCPGTPTRQSSGHASRRSLNL